MANFENGWAVIPAAGVGTRLQPHTHTTPKPLLHVAGKPILAHILDEVVALGIRNIALVVGYRADQIVAFVKENYADCNVVPVQQDQPQGLAQAVFLTREWIDNAPLLIIYGDTIFECDLSRAIAMDSDGAIGVRKVEDPRRFGVVQLKGDQIVGLVEKPETFVSDLAIVGINIIRDSARLFGHIEQMMQKDIRTRGEYQLTDAFNMMVQDGADMRVFSVENWFDCGTAEALLETNRHLLARLPTPNVREGTVLIPPVFVAESAQVTHSILGPYVSIGDGAVIENSRIQDSIVSEGARVIGCFLNQSLVGTYAVVEEAPRRLNVGDSSELRLL